MTREGIKAVRFCMGYKTDLRVKLHNVIPGTTPYRESVAKFLERNLFGIYGVYIMEKLGLPPENPNTLCFEDQLTFSDFLLREADDVCSGVPRDNFPRKKDDGGSNND